jgi:hypothetical protein
MNAEVTLFRKADKSGEGLPHSKTLARLRARYSYREVVECGSPMPLLRLDSGIRSAQPSVHGGGLRLSSFGLRHSFGFRASDFEFLSPWNAS